MQPTLPPALKPGDTIGIVAPAGIVDRVKMERAVERLGALGYRTKTYRDIYAERGYLAGSDEARAAELGAAFADPESNAVFAARGGYGCVRLLDQIDFDLVRDNPKIFLGFSDNTVLHSAFWRTAKLVTFHGPHPCDSYGRPEGPTPLTETWLWRHLTGQGDGLSARVQTRELESYRGGEVEGRLVGGNLALVCTLLGTHYEIDFDQNILFLEDTDEPPYRIDRFLAQLKLNGCFDRISGLILGQFTRCTEPDGTPTLRLDEVFKDYLSSLRCPILTGFPCGHGEDNVTLPFGVRVKLDAFDRSLSFLEPAVRS